MEITVIPSILLPAKVLLGLYPEVERNPLLLMYIYVIPPL